MALWGWAGGKDSKIKARYWFHFIDDKTRV